MKPLELDLDQLKQFNQLNPEQRLNLGNRLNKLTLLTVGTSNTKTSKRVNGQSFKNFILHLAPYKLAGFNVCPKATSGCIASCLNTAGRGKFNSIQKARLRKTLYFRHYRQQFIEHLNREISKLKHKHESIVVRLNGTSDLNWLILKLSNGNNLFIEHNDVQFYDYTKVLTLLKWHRNMRPHNYSLTFSLADGNKADAKQALAMGYNVAAVFKDLPMNKQVTIDGLGKYHVIDGDTHDFRYLDLQGGYIVALKAKGKAKQDNSGFVLRKQIKVKGAA